MVQVSEIVDQTQPVQRWGFQKDLRSVSVPVGIGASAVIVQEAVPTVEGELDSYLVHRLGGFGPGAFLIICRRHPGSTPRSRQYATRP